jgi:hypothetical protein
MAKLFAFFGIFQKRTVRGSAKYDKIMLFIISISFLIVCFSKGLALLHGEANDYYDLDSCASIAGCQSFNQSQNVVQKTAVTTLIISTWCYTYFYLMGFESTGMMYLVF